MITTQDIQAVIALAIQNNRQAFINSMNAAGYTVSQDIDDEDLFAKAWEVYTQFGTQGLMSVLGRVPVNKDLVDARTKAALTAKFGIADNSSVRGFGDWFNNTVTWFGDLIGGQSTGTGPTSTVQSTSALSPAILGIVAALGLVLGLIFRKSVMAVILIIVVVIAVVMYGIFAKNITSTSSGGTTVTHGGIGSIISGWIAGVFK